MKLFILLFGLVAIQARVVYRIRRSTQNEYKMCVPDDLLKYCEDMAAQPTKSNAKIICISARDRIDCIDKIKKHEADFVPVDPEDMYVAGNVADNDFVIFEEIRTLEEPDAEFRYEAVAVVHKNLEVSDLKELKGLKSCHTGVGRNVGYKIPLTKLKSKGIIGFLNDPDLSPRENELKAFSTLFSKACIVGKWSPDPSIDKLWKERYSNLCQLCEKPKQCDYPDNFSGYEGALRCLAQNGGDVAWTKVIYVRKFFGLPVGTVAGKATKENPDNYAYLCPDGTKVPVTGPPCRWAARPWQGYMTNSAVVKSIDELRKKIENLDVLGHKSKAEWLTKVLEIEDPNVAKENKIISPRDYLDKANYTDVIERDYGPPIKSIRFCVLSEDEHKKCRVLSQTAFSRNIRPRFDCVQEKSFEDCFKSIRDNAADIINVNGNQVIKAQKHFNLKPIIAERYSPTEEFSYAVAVVHKNSQYQSFADLKGSKSCHAGYNEIDSFNAPLHHLIRLDLVEPKECPYSRAMPEFFSGGMCLPESDDKKLCSLCVGKKDSNDVSTKCSYGEGESYSGYSGAFRCLVEGGGDVAFIRHSTVWENTGGNNTQLWAAKLKSSDFELLCPEGGRANIDQYERCNLAHSVPNMVVTSNSKSDAEIQEIQNTLLSASDLYSKRPDWFKLFGSFEGKENLLFENKAIGLYSINENSPALAEYTKLSLLSVCDSESSEEM